MFTFDQNIKTIRTKYCREKKNSKYTYTGGTGQSEEYENCVRQTSNRDFFQNISINLTTRTIKIMENNYY